MKWIWLPLLLLAAAGLWLGNTYLRKPAGRADAASNSSAVHTIRLGLAPEQDIFRQRKAYRGLADYLEKKLAADPAEPGGTFRIELVTASSYAAVLKDFEEGKIDAAFLGSLLAIVAVDRYHGEVVVKSEGDEGLSTYSGVVFVLDKSPVKRFDDLRGKRLGSVRTTTGGAVFPLFLMKQAGMSDSPSAANGLELVWSGTHDDVIREVVLGNMDAGAVKDLRLHAYEVAHPETHFRILAESDRYPNNTLVLRQGFPAEQRQALVRALLAVDHDPAASPALAELSVRRYLSCELKEFAGLYHILRDLGPRWDDLKIEGPAPRPPAGIIPSASEGS